ncbi:tryptophan--tRNA ligase [Candidatus Phytoplasma sacchari]|uniref:Tryptophan--tRNA ligase n=1 Tax=Candidatus Phytoplasma sacchari TaxID=2609813 RepID=A0ABY7M3R4_9MOLU|nr:tryptophan--tRNA ligase [Candidatus Phytoplasma sacchari]
MMIKKKRLLTGIKPSGDLTIGNYLGIIKPLILFQKKFPKEYEFYAFIADLHALTNFQEPFLLKKRIKNTALLYLASGLDIDNIVLFVQSDISQNTYLSYILECNTYLGELKRMNQFKDYCLKNKFKNIRTSFFTYPVLMASDILLYDSDIVVVGKDQKQHLELTRNLAIRFNNLYGPTFTVPDFMQIGNTIKSLTDPTKKMSKSKNISKENDDNGCIFLLENLQNIKKKIMKSKTDSENKIKYDPNNKPGISNLINIYSSLKGWDFEKTESYFSDSSYNYFKEKLSELLLSEISMIQKRFFYFDANTSLEEFLEKNAKIVDIEVKKKIDQVKKKIGLK